MQQPQKQPQSLPVSHSLSADIAMGWKPKLKVIGPIPLSFDNHFIDKSIKDVLKSDASIYSVIYLGPRPQNTFKMHQCLKKRYKYKYQHLFSVQYGHLKAFFHKFYSQFEPTMKLPFIGMNPQYQPHKLIFDSCFESGNLDCVVRVRQNQYDLVLRVDSNTNGHILWYYFRVSNSQKKAKRIKLNIVNLRKSKSCYQRGMKPYLRSRQISEQTQTWSQWHQGGQNVEVYEQKIRFGKQTLVMNNGLIGFQEKAMTFRNLSFQIDMKEQQEFQFAYCIPYTYSDLLTDVRHLKRQVAKTNQTNDDIYLEVDTSNESLSGLEIPVLKITGKSDQKYDQTTENQKYCIFIMGRQHPGQSNGSYVMRGILNKLIQDSIEMKFLRKHCVFRVIPMLNVDAVVMGNFRTSLYGKDLNRLFKKTQLFLIPEVQMCKDQFANALKIHKNKIALFLDIHGHSARRNSFCYGPGILDANAFSDVRQFAKMIALKTQIFRYPSCSFRINQDKKTTARACFSKSVGLAYTIQSSNWSFYSKQKSLLIDFSIDTWSHVGSSIMEASVDFFKQKVRLKQEKRKKKLQKQNKDFNRVKQLQKKHNKNQKRGGSSRNSVMLKKSQTPKTDYNYNQSSLSKQKSKKQLSERHNTESSKSDYKSDKHFYQKQRQEQDEQSSQEEMTQYRIVENKQIFNERGKYKLNKQGRYQVQLIQQEENESDKMSDNQMDSDSEGQDMDKEKFEKYMDGAKKMMIQFEKVYLGDDYESKGSTALKLKKINLKNNSLPKQPPRDFRKNTEVMACLRKKESKEQDRTNFRSDSSKMIDIAGKMKLQPRKISINSNMTDNKPISGREKNKKVKRVTEPKQQEKQKKVSTESAEQQKQQFTKYHKSHQFKSSKVQNDDIQISKWNNCDYNQIYNRQIDCGYTPQISKHLELENKKYENDYFNQNKRFSPQKQQKGQEQNYFLKLQQMNNPQKPQTLNKQLSYHHQEQQQKFAKYEDQSNLSLRLIKDNHRYKISQEKSIKQTALIQQSSIVVQNQTLQNQSKKQKGKKYINKNVFNFSSSIAPPLTEYQEKTKKQDKNLINSKHASNKSKQMMTPKYNGDQLNHFLRIGKKQYIQQKDVENPRPIKVASSMHQLSTNIDTLKKLHEPISKSFKPISLEGRNQLQRQKRMRFNLNNQKQNSKKRNNGQVFIDIGKNSQSKSNNLVSKYQYKIQEEKNNKEALIKSINFRNQIQQDFVKKRNEKNKKILSILDTKIGNHIKGQNSTVIPLKFPQSNKISRNKVKLRTLQPELLCVQNKGAQEHIIRKGNKDQVVKKAKDPQHSIRNKEAREDGIHASRSQNKFHAPSLKFQQQAQCGQSMNLVKFGSLPKINQKDLQQLPQVYKSIELYPKKVSGNSNIHKIWKDKQSKAQSQQLIDSKYRKKASTSLHENILNNSKNKRKQKQEQMREEQIAFGQHNLYRQRRASQKDTDRHKMNFKFEEFKNIKSISMNSIEHNEEKQKIEQIFSKDLYLQKVKKIGHQFESK